MIKTSKNTWSEFFDHLRTDFNIRGIIIFNGNGGISRVTVAGYPYYPSCAVNDNEARK